MCIISHFVQRFKHVSCTDSCMSYGQCLVCVMCRLQYVSSVACVHGYRRFGPSMRRFSWQGRAQQHLQVYLQIYLQIPQQIQLPRYLPIYLQVFVAIYLRCKGKWQPRTSDPLGMYFACFACGGVGGVYIYERVALVACATPKICRHRPVDFSLIFSMSYGSVLLSVLCGVFSLCYVRPSVCVVCSFICGYICRSL